MRKPAYCIHKNKGSDQLLGNRTSRPSSAVRPVRPWRPKIVLAGPLFWLIMINFSILCGVISFGATSSWRLFNTMTAEEIRCVFDDI